MKQKLIALVCVLALCLSVVGCGSPATVGKLGETEITSGMYLMAQYSAYSRAQSGATEEQKKLPAAKFLKETLTVDEEGNPVAPVEDAEQATVNAGEYVAAETLRQLQFYAAVEQEFAARGGELTAAQLAAAESDATSLWNSNGEKYEANGIGLNTLRAYELNAYKAQALMEMVYDAEGEKAVSDEELVAYLNEEMVYGTYVAVPLYDPATFTFADEEQQAAMKAAAQAAVEAYEDLLAESNKIAGSEEVSPAAQQLNTMYNVMYVYLPTIYQAMGAEYDVDKMTGDFYTEMFARASLTDNFGEECGEAIAALEVGEMSVANYGGFTMVFFLRLNPLDENEIGALRPRLLSEMKATELAETLQAAGAALANGLSGAAMNSLPASKIQ